MLVKVTDKYGWTKRLIARNMLVVAHERNGFIIGNFDSLEELKKFYEDMGETVEVIMDEGIQEA